MSLAHHAVVKRALSLAFDDVVAAKSGMSLSLAASIGKSDLSLANDVAVVQSDLSLDKC